MFVIKFLENSSRKMPKKSSYFLSDLIDIKSEKDTNSINSLKGKMMENRSVEYQNNSESLENQSGVIQLNRSTNSKKSVEFSDLYNIDDNCTVNKFSKFQNSEFSLSFSSNEDQIFSFNSRMNEDMGTEPIINVSNDAKYNQIYLENINKKSKLPNFFLNEFNNKLKGFLFKMFS
jgi:hypothetical protein